MKLDKKFVGLVLGLALSVGLSAQTTEKYFVMSTAGWGPQVGTSGDGSVGIKVASGVYSLTTLDLAGGIGAVNEDVAYKATTSRGVTLWGFGGAGFTSTNTTTDTSYDPTFGGGLMLTYDMSKITPKLANFELVAQVRISYGSYTTTTDGVTSTAEAVKPSYRFGVKFNFPE
jgi:hypothetical protein